MDKVKKYQEIIINFLKQQVDAVKADSEEVKRELIIDRESNNFQLFHIGWKGKQYHFIVAIHLAIINKKIWLQWNRTEHEIVDFLMEQGVPKNDIVLGLKPPSVRRHTGFAKA